MDQTATPMMQSGVPLPKTATDAEIRMLIGLFLLAGSLLLVLFGRRAVRA